LEKIPKIRVFFYFGVKGGGKKTPPQKTIPPFKQTRGLLNFPPLVFFFFIFFFFSRPRIRGKIQTPLPFPRGILNKKKNKKMLEKTRGEKNC